jgi:phage tail sheath protein FI
MAINLSPGVNVSEIDLTTTVPGVATSIGAIAGAFQWGPVLEVRTISSEVELVDTFNKPNNDVADTFFSAANFLSYSNALRVVRNVGSTARNATNGASGISGLTIVTAGVSNANSQMAPGTFALTFTGGGGSGAQGTATLAYGGATGVLVSAVSLTDAGTGYSTTPTVTVTGATGFTTVPVITASTANTILIKNEEDYQQNYISGVDSAAGTWTSKYPGVLGNSLKVSICDSTGFTGWTYASSFGIAPGTSTYAAQNGGSLDELHIIVIDEDGKFTGTQNSVLEKFEFVSKASDAKTESGESNYYANVINNRSRYIWWTNHPRTTTDWGTTASSAGAYDAVPGGAITSSLTAGVDANVLSNGEIQAGYDLFADAETIDVNLIIGASANSTVGTYLVQSIAENRGDAVVFLSPTKVSVVDNKGQEVTDITTFRNTLPSSSYAVVDSGWKYQYDKYNDVFRWVPLNADIAGLCARTDATNDPWFSPAGFNRGNLKNVVKLAFNPSKANRDDLFKIGINPVVTFPGQGTVLFGDKTLLSKPSAFDRINVRRLFNVLKKSISTASKFSLFELNDEFTRAQFVGLVEPFLRDVQGRRGITDFKVVCDTTNNTPQVIDSNSFVGDIYIKPARSINFIQLNFVAVRTGVEFSEIIGQF